MSQPAITVRTRVVPVQLVDEFREWADAIDAAVARSPGHRGTVRLEQGGGLVHLLHQFDDEAARDAWERSPERDRLLAAGDRFPVERRQDGAGPRLRFLVPSESSASKPKLFVATWIAVFPMLLILSTAVRWAAGGLPQPLQLCITSLMATALLTWLVLPRVNRLLRPWQLSDGGDEARA